MTAFTVHWEYEGGDTSRVIYFIDGVIVGEGDVGFDNILRLVKAKPGAKVILHGSGSNSFGGEKLQDSFPFGARYRELVEALGEGNIAFRF